MKLCIKVLVGICLPVLKVGFDVSSSGTSAPRLRLRPLPLVFADPDLLTCFADLLALLCSSGWVLWDGAMSGRALHCPSPSPAASPSPAVMV